MFKMILASLFFTVALSLSIVVPRVPTLSVNPTPQTLADFGSNIFQRLRWVAIDLMNEYDNDFKITSVKEINAISGKFKADKKLLETTAGFQRDLDFFKVKANKTVQGTTKEYFKYLNLATKGIWIDEISSPDFGRNIRHPMTFDTPEKKVMLQNLANLALVAKKMLNGH